VSIRRFTAEPVADADVTKLLEAAMQAPSAGNQQPWAFIVVTQKDMLARLSGSSPYAKPLAQAPLGIVVLLDKAGLRFPECWQQDLAACTQNLLLEAVHLGLGAVWLAVADFKDRMAAAKEILGLPSHIEAFAYVALGHPAEEKTADPRYDPSRVRHGSW
jgi:nitroreductase